MASSKEYLEFIIGQLSELEGITYRAVMGEFIIYYRGKVVGGIYDDRLLVKPVTNHHKRAQKTEPSEWRLVKSIETKQSCRSRIYFVPEDITSIFKEAPTLEIW